MTSRPSWPRRLVRLFVKLAICYLGVVIVLLALENSLLYHPVRATEEWCPVPTNSDVEDIELTTADGTRIHAWWCPRPGATGALLYCHGNAGNLSHRNRTVTNLLDKVGESVLIFDYPGYGRSEGTPSEAGCYAAADAAYDWLTETKRIWPERIILYGKSLGGGVAVELASRRPHRALILVRTFTSIPDVAQQHYPFLPARWLVRNRFDNLQKIGRCTRPVFIAQGDRDSLIPFSHGKRLFAAANEPKTFFCLKGCDHNDPFPTDYFVAIRRFLETYAPTNSQAGSAN